MMFTVFFEFFAYTLRSRLSLQLNMRTIPMVNACYARYLGLESFK